MYWSDVGTKKIEFANLDGSNRTVLVYSADIGQPVSLHFYQNKLLVADLLYKSQIIVLNVTSETNSSVYADGVVGGNETFATLYGVLIFHQAEIQGTFSNNLTLPY